MARTWVANVVLETRLSCPVAFNGKCRRAKKGKMETGTMENEEKRDEQIVSGNVNSSEESHRLQKLAKANQ